jgi:hypothetical protein
LAVILPPRISVAVAIFFLTLIPVHLRIGLSWPPEQQFCI